MDGVSALAFVSSILAVIDSSVKVLSQSHTFAQEIANPFADLNDLVWLQPTQAREHQDAVVWNLRIGHPDGYDTTRAS